MGVDLPW